MAQSPKQSYQRVPTKTTFGGNQTIIGINNKGEVTLSYDIRGVPSQNINVNGQNIPVPFAYWDSNQKKFFAYDSSIIIPDGTPSGQSFSSWIIQNEDSLTKNSTAIINKTYKDDVETRSKFNLPGVHKETVKVEPVVVGAGSTPSESGSTKLTPEERKKLEEFEFDVSKSRSDNQWENLRYPDNLAEKSCDVITFSMVTYGTRFFDKEFIRPSEKRKFGKTLATVTLPIQPRITDTNQVNWQEADANLISLGMAQSSLGIIEEGFDGLLGSVDKLGASLKTEKSNVELALKTYFAGQAASTQNLLGRLTGGILNPNLELLFDGPTTRSFNYNFVFSPRDDKETIKVAKIIRFFKEGMAVQRSNASLFLKAPNVFKIDYLFKEEDDHPFLNRIKGPCALTNCTVDYTPNGTYMTFTDGSMISYNVSLTFQELEPLYADDYKSIPKEQIGY